MRKALEKYFVENAEEENMVMLLGDLGHYPTAKNAFPDRVINVGCMESNMVNFAVGLASQGFHVLIYTVAGFTIHKAYDQLKMMVPDIRLPGKITIFNAGPGFPYHEVGRGHYLLDDISLMFPIATLYFPKSKDELNHSFHWINNTTGTLSYIRGNFDNVPAFISNRYTESEKTIITTPTQFHRVCELCDLIETDVNIVTPTYGVSLYLQKDVFVIEDHQEHGGLGDIYRRIHGPLSGHIYTKPFVDKASKDISEVHEAAGISDEIIKTGIMEWLKQ